MQNDPDFPWKDRDPDKLIFEWFVTARIGTGLRLTDAGAKAFEQAKIAHYNFDFDENIKNFALPNTNWEGYAMLLNKKIHCPYYVGVRIDEKKKKHPYIRVYDHKIAMLITLYGSVNSYMESVK